MKKILKKIFILFSFMFWFFNQTSAKWSDYINITWNWWNQSWGWKSEAPTIKAWWLPGNSGEGNMEKFLVNFTDFFIWIIAVIAVLALIISWIMYMLSGWEPEKAKKAKSWIIWALIWVLLSAMSFTIIRLLNTINL